METDATFRARIRSELWNNGAYLTPGQTHAIETSTGTVLDRVGKSWGMTRAGERVTTDPFGDAVKAAQHLPEPHAAYVPDRFSADPGFDVDAAWRAVVEAGQ